MPGLYRSGRGGKRMRRPKQEYIDMELRTDIARILEYTLHTGASYAQIIKAIHQYIRAEGVVIDEY